MGDSSRSIADGVANYLGVRYHSEVIQQSPVEEDDVHYPGLAGAVPVNRGGASLHRSAAARDFVRTLAGVDGWRCVQFHQRNNNARAVIILSDIVMCR
jgi:hypothetical protein